MKVLHLLPSLNLYGGTPKKVLDLAKHSKYEHIIFCWSMWESEDDFFSFKNEFENQGVKVFEVFSKFKQPTKIQMIKSLFSLIKKEKINIIHSYFELGQVIGMFAKIRFPNVKLVTAFVGSNSDISFIGKPLVSFSHLFYSKIIYISKYVKKSQENHYPLLKLKSNQIVFNGTYRRKCIDTIKFIPTDKFNMVTVSGLNQYKNLFVLINAMNTLKIENKLKNIQLNIIGDGPLRDELESLISKYGLGDVVLLHGYQKDIGAILNKCDLYLHPSDCEGFGIAVIEAMRAGLPVIVSNAGALPEVVGSESNGMIVEPYNPSVWASSIAKMHGDTEHRRLFAINSYIRSRKTFSVKQFVNNHEVIYCQLFE